jgi:hypothetical protein
VRGWEQKEGGAQGTGVLKNLDHSASLGVRERNEGKKRKKEPPVINQSLYDDTHHL